MAQAQGIGARPWPAWLTAPWVAVEGARGHLLPFAPVLMGVGIAVYFGLATEPPVWALWAAGTLAVGLAVLGTWGPAGPRLAWLACACLAAGLALAGARAHRVAAPVLPFRYHGPIEGRLVWLDRSAGDALRLTLDQIVLPGRDPGTVPARVRVALHGPPPDVEPVPGTRLAVTGHLSPPNGPVEPGGFDHRRYAWFGRLGAVGYSRNPLVELAPPEPGPGLAVARLRMRLSAGLRARIPGEEGGFVAAVLTGDRSGVGLQTTQALRDSNLAHLLSISGLHMGLLTGAVYGAARGALALVPPLALRLPIRKIAAVLALLAATFYLALSGGDVATQRSYVMVAVVLVAVLADRRAISLRAVGIAALIVLVWMPEALINPGFQMSFAATIALIAVFAGLRTHDYQPGARRWPRWARRGRDVVLCSLVAGLATAPFAAATFHRHADYGLLANLLGVPVMGALVMPAAVLSAVLWPVGLDWVGLALMQAGARWILGVAHWVAGFPGAVRPIPAPPGWVVPVMTLGGLWLALWPGRARWAGVAPVVVALLAWGTAPRPTVLVAEGGGLVGVLTPDGRALSRARGEGFAAREWLGADGDGADQEGAALRAGWTTVPGGWAMDLGPGRLVHLAGRGAADRVAQHCLPGATVVLAARWDGPAPGPCILWDHRALARSGSLALPADAPEWAWIGARAQAGARLWTQGR